MTAVSPLQQQSSSPIEARSNTDLQVMAHSIVGAVISGALEAPYTPIDTIPNNAVQTQLEDEAARKIQEAFRAHLPRAQRQILEKEALWQTEEQARFENQKEKKFDIATGLVEKGHSKPMSALPSAATVVKLTLPIERDAWIDDLCRESSKSKSKTQITNPGVQAIIDDAQKILHYFQTNYQLPPSGDSWCLPIQILLDVTSSHPLLLGYMANILDTLLRGKGERATAIDVKVVAFAITVASYHHKKEVSETVGAFCSTFDKILHLPRKNAIYHLLAVADTKKVRMLDARQAKFLNIGTNHRISLIDVADRTTANSLSDLQQITHDVFHECVLTQMDPYVQSSFTKMFATAETNALSASSDLCLALQQLQDLKTRGPIITSRASFSATPPLRRTSGALPPVAPTKRQDLSLSEQLVAIADHDQSNTFGPNTLPYSRYTLFAFACIFVLCHRESYSSVLPTLYEKIDAHLNACNISSAFLATKSAESNLLKGVFECFCELVTSDHFITKLDNREAHWLSTPSPLIPLAIYFASEKYVVPRLSAISDDELQALQLFLSASRVFLSARMNMATLMLSPSGAVPRRRLDGLEAHAALVGAIREVNGRHGLWSASSVGGEAQVGKSAATWGMLLHVSGSLAVAPNSKDAIPPSPPSLGTNARFVRSSVLK